MNSLKRQGISQPFFTIDNSSTKEAKVGEGQLPGKQLMETIRETLNKIEQQETEQNQQKINQNMQEEAALKHFLEFVKQTQFISDDQINLTPIKEIYNIKIDKLMTIEEAQEKYYKIFEKTSQYKNVKKNWNDTEISILIWIVIKTCVWKKIDYRDISDNIWDDVSKIFVCRTRDSCKFKWLSLSKLNLLQLPWNQDEDELLIKIILEFKEANRVCKWSEVAKELNGRSGRNLYRAGKQCRERWNNHLDPNVCRGPWNDKEDLDLLKLIQEKGKKWSEISKCIPTSRTENAVKNRFNSLVKKEKASSKFDTMNYPTEKQLIELIMGKIESKLKHGFNIVSLDKDYENNDDSCKSDEQESDQESDNNNNQQLINGENERNNKIIQSNSNGQKIEDTQIKCESEQKNDIISPQDQQQQDGDQIQMKPNVIKKRKNLLNFIKAQEKEDKASHQINENSVKLQELGVNSNFPEQLQQNQADYLGNIQKDGSKSTNQPQKDSDTASIGSTLINKFGKINFNQAEIETSPNLTNSNQQTPAQPQSYIGQNQPQNSIQRSKQSLNNSNNSQSTQKNFSPLAFQVQQQQQPVQQFQQWQQPYFSQFAQVQPHRQLLNTELQLTVRDIAELKNEQQFEKLEFSLIDLNNKNIYLCSIELLLHLIQQQQRQQQQQHQQNSNYMKYQQQIQQNPNFQPSIPLQQYQPAFQINQQQLQQQQQQQQQQPQAYPQQQSPLFQNMQQNIFYSPNEQPYMGSSPIIPNYVPNLFQNQQANRKIQNQNATQAGPSFNNFPDCNMNNNVNNEMSPYNQFPIPPNQMINNQQLLQKKSLNSLSPYCSPLALTPPLGIQQQNPSNMDKSIQMNKFMNPQLSPINSSQQLLNQQQIYNQYGPNVQVNQQPIQ